MHGQTEAARTEVALTKAHGPDRQEQLGVVCSLLDGQVLTDAEARRAYAVESLGASSCL